MDSELDTKTSFEIEQHLRNCANCDEYFEGERRADLRIHTALQAGVKNDLLWHQIESQLVGAPSAKSGKGRRWWLAVTAVAASIALGLLVFPRTDFPANDLAAAAATDHAKYLAGNMPLQFVGEPSPEALATTEGRLDRAAFSILPVSTSFKPEGKRLCRLNGVPVAWMTGNSAGKAVSVIVMKREELDGFPALKKRFAEGHRIACFKAGGYQFGARRVDDHVVCVVGDLPRPELESLLASVSPAL